MEGKRGQFFLLAAVIISAVIISFGAGTNMAIVNEESKDFYSSSEEAQREIAAFLDYAVFSNINNAELDDFLVSLAENMEETNPNVDFAFIYKGNGHKLEIRNYGSREIYVNDIMIEARGQREITSTEGNIVRTYYENEPVEEKFINLGNNVDSFSVKLEEDSESVVFPFLDNQVVLVTQKEERGDVYVSIG